MSATALASRLPSPSRAVQRSVGVTAVLAQGLIAVTGSVVRVTGSGLGCPTWPRCTATSMVPVSHSEIGAFHQWVEFGNRLLTIAVCVVAAICLITALLVRPRRKRYTWLAATMPLGVIAEGIIGGMTVLAGLAWWTVAIHFLVSPLLVWCAVLFYRAADEGDEPARALLPRELPIAATVLLALVLAAGTLVTGAGPHGGDANTPRLGLPIQVLTGVHGGLLGAFLVVVAVIGLRLRRDATATLRSRYRALVLIVLLQGALGIGQYFAGVPDYVVPFHVLGAVLVVGGMASLWCAARDRGTAPQPVTHASSTDAAETVAA